MKKILILMTIFISLTMTSYSNDSNLDTADSSENQSVTFENNNSDTETAESIKEKSEEEKENLKIYNNYMEKGKAEYENQNYGDSLDAYSEASKLKVEDNTGSLLGEAKSYEAIEEKKKALIIYKRILKNKPENPIAIRRSLLLEGDYVQRWGYKTKEAYFEKFEDYLKKENYSNSEDIYTLGRIYMDDKSFERAYNIFRQERHGDYRNYFGAAATSNFLGKRDVAISFYKKTISIKPDFNRSYLGIATAYKLKGDYDAALDNLEMYLDKKKDPNVYVGIADIYMAQKKLNSARDILEEGQKEFPSSARIRESLGDIYSKLGR